RLGFEDGRAIIRACRDRDLFHPGDQATPGLACPTAGRSSALFLAAGCNSSGSTLSGLSSASARTVRPAAPRMAHRRRSLTRCPLDVGELQARSSDNAGLAGRVAETIPGLAIRGYTLAFGSHTG